MCLSGIKGPRQRHAMKVRRNNDEEMNPCIREQIMSFKCLEDNDYDRDKCSKFFKNYRNCKKFWAFVVKNRTRDGVSPALPPKIEREEIRRKFVESGAFNTSEDNGTGS